MKFKRLFLIFTTSFFTLTLLLIIIPNETTYIRAADNPIVAENKLPGTTAWQPDQTGLTFSDDTIGQVKGFASLTSVNKGNPIDFFITSNAADVTMNVYRIGWYNQAGGRLMNSTPIVIPGKVQPACNLDANIGLLSCSNWSKSYTLNVPSTWTSGIYVVHMITNTNFHDYIIFTVRDDGRTADLLYQQSVTTYQAYNDYPNDLTTGKSLYAFNSQGPNTIGGDKRAVKVSFDRPYASGNSFSFRGHGDGEFFSWEIYMVRWLESKGYDVTYSTDIDTHENPSRLKTVKGFISIGHDEYYSKQMYDAVTSARDAGTNFAFFGANDIYNQIRLETGAQGNADRTVVHYRDSKLDPIADKSLATIPWRSLNISPRPEEGMIGVQYSGHDTWNTALPGGGNTVDYVVNNASNWVYNNTGFTEGQHIPRIVGYETDRDNSGDSGGPPLPANLSYTLLSHSPYISPQHGNVADYANSVIYQAPSGAWVFGAGSIAWSWGLDNWRSENFANAGIQQMTVNILDRFVANKSTAQTIAPAADAYIAADAPDTKLGQFPFLYVNGFANTVRKTFLRFDLSPFTGQTISGATLTLTTTGATNAKSTGTQNVHLLSNNSWDENTLTWNNSPQASISASVIGSLTNANQLNTPFNISLDLATIQSHLGGLISVVIDSNSNDDIVFNSKEASGSPQLSLTFNSSPLPSPSPSPSPSPLPTFRIFDNKIPTFIQTDPNPIELGVKFRSSQAGKILGIRFYKGTGNTGIHTGTIWSLTGTKLATATFANETATGWEEVLFTTPVLITPNTTYIASYHTTTGHFAQTAPGFSTAFTNGPLTALHTGADGLNGIFLYGVGGFPNQSWNSSNYWVDVIFQ